MARCLTLTSAQTSAFDAGWTDERRVRDDVLDWATRLKPHEPGIVMTADNRIAYIVTGIAIEYGPPSTRKDQP